MVLACIMFSGWHSFSQSKFSEQTKSFIAFNVPVIAMKDALLIDGTGNAAKPHQTVIISNGKIDWVGNNDKASIPAAAAIIDLNGKALMPGFVMLHEHMYISAHAMEQRYAHLRQTPATFPRLYLGAGATTIRTAGNVEPYSDLNLKKDIDAGKIPGPQMEVTAPYLEGKGSMFPQMKHLATPEDAVAFVNFWADQGFTSFKAYMFINKPTLKAAIDAVHARGLKITGHLCAVTYREAAEMGIDQLEHGFVASTDFQVAKKENECPPNADYALAGVNVDTDASVRQLLQYLVAKKTIITSTLAVFEGYTAAQPAPSAELLSYFSPDSRDFYQQQLAGIKSSPSIGDDDKVFVNNARMEKMFYDMGGLLTVGTDPTGNGGTIAGFGNWRAIELLVEADGFTPLQAIRIATLNGASALGLQHQVGTIAIGKQADLIIVDGDPSTNISDIRKVQYVFKQGIGFDAKKLFASVKGRVGFN